MRRSRRASPRCASRATGRLRPLCRPGHRRAHRSGGVREDRDRRAGGLSSTSGLIRGGAVRAYGVSRRAPRRAIRALAGHRSMPRTPGGRSPPGSRPRTATTPRPASGRGVRVADGIGCHAQRQNWQSSVRIRPDPRFADEPSAGGGERFLLRLGDAGILQLGLTPSPPGRLRRSPAWRTTCGRRERHPPRRVAACSCTRIMSA